MKWIIEAESLEDMLNDNYSMARELIQCKDCEHGTEGTGAKVYCDEFAEFTYQWDYCGRAERRESC